METQRSFNLKSPKFLVFSFTVFSSLIFLSFFSFWVFKFTPSIPPQETHLLLNKSFTNQALHTVTVQSLTGFGGNLSEIPILNPNTSWFHGKSSNGTIQLLGSERYEEEEKKKTTSMEETEVSMEETEVSNNVRMEGRREKAKECDVTVGKWVFDESYPLYTNDSCPFIDEGFNCLTNGRLDKDYVKWRWQPRDCHIPRFDPERMLNLIRGKRLVFVGDSINRNQWESMLCLLMAAIKDPKRVYETRGRKITKERGNYSYRFADYQCTVEYYVSHFLVHESKARVGRKRTQTLRIDAIDRGASRWKGADILIFNTAHWWSHHKTKAGINYYQEGNQVYPQLHVNTAFRRALNTWAAWIEKYANPRKTQVFFRSSSPSHFRGGHWNSGGHCMEATRPLNGTSSTGYPDKNVIAEEVLKQMKNSITYLNVTNLSELRIDGHPSVYGRKPVKSIIQDCSHWCLPGIPDTWNELLYFHLQTKHKES